MSPGHGNSWNLVRPFYEAWRVMENDCKVMKFCIQQAAKFLSPTTHNCCQFIADRVLHLHNFSSWRSRGKSVLKKRGHHGVWVRVRVGLGVRIGVSKC